MVDMLYAYVAVAFGGGFLFSHFARVAILRRRKSGPFNNSETKAMALLNEDSDGPEKYEWAPTWKRSKIVKKVELLDDQMKDGVGDSRKISNELAGLGERRDSLKADFKAKKINEENYYNENRLEKILYDDKLRDGNRVLHTLFKTTNTLCALRSLLTGKSNANVVMEVTRVGVPGEGGIVLESLVDEIYALEDIADPMEALRKSVEKEMKEDDSGAPSPKRSGGFRL